MVSGGRNLKKHERGRDKKRKRNRKGKIASARLRQVNKRNQQLRKKLKDGGKSPSFCIMILMQILWLLVPAPFYITLQLLLR